ncbi:MAG: OmpA family protein [Bdellovibrionaceae bacterium]|nr:OmpA family protein [Pseudobdellovibrionaceae bacterium]
MNTNFKHLILVGALALTAACSSKAPKGELSSASNPQEEIASLSNDMNESQLANVDVLAREDYKKASKSLDEAKSDYAANKDQEKVIDDLRFGRSYLKSATAKAVSRQGKAPGLFESRQNAIKAGAMKYPELKKEWADVDDDVADEARELEKVSAKDLVKFQARYAVLEQKAVVQTQLGDAKAKFNAATTHRGSRVAPQSYRKAELSIKGAETVIGSNVKNPAGYQKAVDTANTDANFLNDVMDTIKQNDNISEVAAIKMVRQNQQISGLKNNLTKTELAAAGVKSQLEDTNKTLEEKQKALEASGKEIQEKENALMATEKNLDKAQSSVALQAAIEKSRTQFSPTEAEAYQQGGNLLIRLKSMNFANGKAELPTESMALLSKVSEVAKSLNAKEIKVEGHTDSVGASDLNKKLSEDRANAVATYFKTNGFEKTPIAAEGYGFEKPIATNKSKNGRAQNRRVDIIITPEGTAAINQ